MTVQLTDLIVVERSGVLYKATTGEVVAEKQDTLISGTNIKTVNGESLLGAGNITISGGGGGGEYSPVLGWAF
jgi:hypothetical protein